MITSLGISWHMIEGQDFSFNFSYLGFCGSLSDHTVTLTVEKHIHFKAKVNTFLEQFTSKPCTRLNTMKVNGSLSHITMVYPEGHTYLPNILQILLELQRPPPIASLRSPHGDRPEWWSSKLMNPSTARSLVPRGEIVDLNFWMDTLSSRRIGLLFEGHWAAWKWLDGLESDFQEIGWAEGVTVKLAVHLLNFQDQSNLHILLCSNNVISQKFLMNIFLII